MRSKVRNFHVYNSAFTPEFAQLVREKGRALKWIQFSTVGIDIALKAGLPEGVWITSSGDVSQRVLAGHAITLMREPEQLWRGRLGGERSDGFL
jgi:hypothetical protein